MDFQDVVFLLFQASHTPHFLIFVIEVKSSGRHMS